MQQVEPIKGDEVLVFNPTLVTGSRTMAMTFIGQNGKKLKALYTVPDNLVDTVIKNLMRLRPVELPPVIEVEVPFMTA